MVAAVSSMPMPSARCNSMGPVSSPRSIRMMVIPVRWLPSMIARWMGAAPRYWGKSEPWTLKGPMVGMSSTDWGRMRP